MRLNNALKSLRQTLHANPFVSNDEGWTARAVCAFLEAHSVAATHTNINGGHGVIFQVQGTKDPSTVGTPSVLLRADMDALPLIEQTPGIDYISTRHGCHHACGHDGHATMLAGALAQLQAQRHTFSGTVIGLLQPAEETGDGALQMLGGNIPLPSRGCFGLHNIPGQPLGHILLRDDGITARASCGARILIQGKASHASQPENGVSPAPVLATILSRFSELPIELLEKGLIKPQLGDRAVLAIPVHVRLGQDGDFGISPGDACINITFRADSTSDLHALTNTVQRFVTDEAENHGCCVTDVQILEEFPAVVNDDRRSSIVRQVAEHLDIPVHTLDAPFPWSEDFAHFGERCDSGAVLFGLGAGEECPPLHSRHYNFPDSLLEVGVDLWTNISKAALADPP